MVEGAPSLGPDEGTVRSSWWGCIARNINKAQPAQTGREPHAVSEVGRKFELLSWPCKERFLRVDQRFHEKEQDKLFHHMLNTKGTMEELEEEVSKEIRNLTDVAGQSPLDESARHVKTQVALLRRVVNAFDEKKQAVPDKLELAARTSGGVLPVAPEQLLLGSTDPDKRKAVPDESDDPKEFSLAIPLKLPPPPPPRKSLDRPTTTSTTTSVKPDEAFEAKYP